jgi:hypothetical protein
MQRAHHTELLLHILSQTVHETSLPMLQATPKWAAFILPELMTSCDRSAAKF